MLTTAKPWSLPTRCVELATAGQEAVFEAGSSLVFVRYDDREHTMVRPSEVRLINAFASTSTTSLRHVRTAVGAGPPARGQGPTHTRRNNRTTNSPKKH